MSRNTVDRRSVLRGIGVGTAVVVGGTGTALADEDEAGDGDAKVRVAHAVPDAPEVDVTLTNTDDEDVSATVTVAFTDVTGYLEVPPGEYEIAVPAAGFSATVELDAEDYTAAATGNLSPEGDEDGFDVDLFEDTLGVIGDGNGRVRAYHLSPDAPAVDVAVADEDGEPTVFLAEGIEFGEAGDDVEVEAGTYPVAVYPAGSSEPVFGPVDVEVRDGEVLSALAEGELDPEDDEDGFDVVLAREEAAPFGRGGRDDDDGDDEDDDRGRGRDD